MTVMVAVFAVKDHWEGSARELLDMLRQTARNQTALPSLELLPKNEDAVGIWLRKNGLALRERGLEVWRPNKTARKRLWAMERQVAITDTSDTSAAIAPGEVPSSNDLPCNEMGQEDTCDTSNEDMKEILNLFQEQQPS